MDYFIYFLSIFLCMFQDLPLANYIGDYGRSISGIFATVVLFYSLIKNKKIYFNNFIKILLLLLIFLLFFNIVTFAGYAISGRELNILGENIFLKSVKVYMYFFSNVIYILSLYQLGKNFNEKKLLKPFFYIYLILFVLSIIEYIQLPSAFPFLHANRPYAYNRIRLLTNESSNSTTIILVFFTLALQYSNIYKSKKTSSLLILSLLFFIYTTTSKSLFLVLAISIVFLLIFNNKIKTKNKILISFLFLFSIVFLSNSVMNYFNLARNSSTTFYTRGYTLIVSFIMSIKYPLGVSNTLYLPVFTAELKDKLDLAHNLITDFNSSEINYILTSGSDKNISAYAGLFQYGLYWGIIGNIFFVSNILKNIKNTISKNQVLFFGFITIALCVLTTISLDNKYEIWAFLFILIMYNEKEGLEEWKE